MLARAKGMSPNPRAVAACRCRVGAVADHQRCASNSRQADRRCRSSSSRSSACPAWACASSRSVQTNDLLTLQAIAAVLAVAVVLANFVVDLLYAAIDPRDPPREGPGMRRCDRPALTAVAAADSRPRGAKRRAPGPRPSARPALLVIGAMAARADYLPFIRNYSSRCSTARNRRPRPGSDFRFGSDQLERATCSPAASTGARGVAARRVQLDRRRARSSVACSGWSPATSEVDQTAVIGVVTDSCSPFPPVRHRRS